MDKTYKILESYRAIIKDDKILEFIDDALNTSKLYYSKSLLSKLDKDTVKRNHDRIKDNFSKEEQELISKVLYEDN
jgi:hypothetical protein